MFKVTLDYYTPVWGQPGVPEMLSLVNGQMDGWMDGQTDGWTDSGERK